MPLNGYKTYIGAAILLIVGIMKEVVVGIWGFEAPWVEPTIQTLEWINRVGLGIVLAGFGHKVVKKKMNGAGP
jgi:hypothetical protein